MTRTLLGLLSLFVLTPHLYGSWFDSTTGLDLKTLPRFALKKIYAGTLRDPKPAVLPGFRIDHNVTASRSSRVTGAGKSGRTWEARFCCIEDIWAGDLDGNGETDYVFHAVGPYFNGRTTPTSSLSLLLMDEDRMPVPFFTVIYHHDQAMLRIVDTDRDGRAEILISSYDEARSDPHAQGFCSGHWVHQLYRFENQRAVKVVGTGFPLIHGWTDPGCEKEAKQPVEPATIRDRGTSRLSDPACANSVSGAIIVHDTPAARKIAFPNLFSDDQERLIREIRKAKAILRFAGGLVYQGSEVCGANLVWANK